MQSFEVTRTASGYTLGEAVEKFKKYGLIVLKECLPRDTREDMRQILTDKLEDARAKGHVLRYPEYPKADFLLGDVPSIRQLEKYDYVFFRPDLLQVIKGVLATDRVIYYGDSSTQFDAAARGFHKDHVERTNAMTDDWVGDYGVIRCAFYCEDHAKHSGGLKVRLRSHNVEACRSMFDRTKISQHAGRAVDVRSNYGDIVMWSMRLTHSGNYKKLKLLPSLCLHPRIEAVLPDWLALPEQDRRYFMSCAFGRPGSHLEHYLNNLLTKREADIHPYLERARKMEEIDPYLQRRGVEFRKPCDYYGQVDTEQRSPTAPR